VVSGSLSSPCRGAFHLSLTVLVHYRSLKIFSLGGWSPQLPTRFHVPRGTQDPNQSHPACLYGTLTRSGGAFQRLRVGRGACHVGPTTPLGSKPQRFGLFPVRSPLLRESRLISLRRATEMFQFAHGPPPCLYIQHGVSRHHSGRVAPLGYSGLIARMQLPLNVSPVSASFIGLQRLGIHLVLCLACASLPSSRRDIRWFVVYLFRSPVVIRRARAMAR
jgi:hypothetical protein